MNTNERTRKQPCSNYTEPQHLEEGKAGRERVETGMELKTTTIRRNNKIVLG